MKRFLTSVLLLLALCSYSFGRELVATGKSNTQLGDYKIWTSDNPVTINGEEHKTYIITYANSPTEVQVVITKGKKCKNYVVLSDKLSVQYVCSEDYFGVQKLGTELAIQGFSTSDKDLNRNEYFHQKVLGPGRQSELNNAHLIASYFPRLINPSI